MTLTDFEKKSKVTHDRKNPYPATLLECRYLNKTGSSKENLHVVVDLKDSNITYKVGSSFGIYPENHPQYVQEILELLNYDQEQKIYDKRSQTELSINDFFTKKINLSQLTSSLFRFFFKHTQNQPLLNLIENKEETKTYISQNDLISFLNEFWRPGIPLQEFCDLLSPLLPRYYSIASAMSKVGSKAHFMVASFKYNHAGKVKQSVTSDFFKTHCTPMKSKVSLFLQENLNFTLPEDPSTPIIMIGPGTGLAVFRGFLQERIETNAPGKNWLFTGDRERKYDFHYEEELSFFEKKGLLKLSTAFSRDGPEKVYVQDEMLKHSEELWDWLNNKNASIYICGDAKKMAKDVQSTLITIAEIRGNLSKENAKSFIKQLRKDKRLLLDVY